VRDAASMHRASPGQPLPITRPPATPCVSWPTSRRRVAIGAVGGFGNRDEEGGRCGPLLGEGKGAGDGQPASVTSIQPWFALCACWSPSQPSGVVSGSQ
jgi:hypothetical protein